VICMTKEFTGKMEQKQELTVRHKCGGMAVGLRVPQSPTDDKTKPINIVLVCNTCMISEVVKDVDYQTEMDAIEKPSASSMGATVE